MITESFTRPAFQQIAYRRHAGPLIEPAACSRTRTGHGRLSIALALAAIAAVFAGRAGTVALRTSLTFDEDTHLSRGLFAWSTGGDPNFWKLGTPALPHMLNALPSYACLKLARSLPESSEFAAYERLVRSGEARTLVPARLVVVAWGIGLVLFTYMGVARAWGAAQGLWAATLISMVPEVLAHSAIAGSDIPSVTAAVLSVILLARFAERPTAGRWLAVAIAVGLAWALRHSAILLIVLASLVHLRSSLGAAWRQGWKPRARALVHSARAAGLLSAIAFLGLWAGDGFGLIPQSELFRLRVDRSMNAAPSGSKPIDRAVFPNSLGSLVTQVHHQNQGHPAYFCGGRRLQGWRTYFPTALALKTPLGLLVLMILAAARIRPTCQFAKIALALLVLTWITLFRSRVDIGLRYALITYPLIVPFVARLFDLRYARDRFWSPIAWLALAAFAWASVSCHPRYLSYFNEIAGGPSQGYLYLSDSNVDWGQDHDAMLVALENRGIGEATAALLSPRTPTDPGVRLIDIAQAQSPGTPAASTRLIPQAIGKALAVPTRYIVVSATRLHRVYTDVDLYWLFTRQLVERIGDSIFLFDMDTAADDTIGR